MTENQTGDRIGRRKTILLVGGAVVALATIGIIFVLPAETGIDPTGFGKASGLTEIANPQASLFLERGQKRKGVLILTSAAPQPIPGVRDHWTYELHPYEEIELKYILDKGAPMAFSWRADGPLAYDMHAHPFDGGEELTESYVIADGAGQSGHYIAAFSGIHGWHWQNRSMKSVRLTLDTSGRIKGSKLLDGRSTQDRALTPPTNP